ncbi:MAG TPA: glycoside hydrolase family 3 N-terminal domain-containing protein, partial [Chitinophagales bacterium]
NVAVKGVEYMDGLQSQNVVACAKHFPGHGDTDADSHQTLPTINKSLEQLDTLELYPFRVLFNAGVASVMTAHLSLPKIDSTQNLPSSLSPIVTTDLLRKKLGFQGLVVTDALNMKGASKFYAPGVVDSMAFAAGNDVLEYSLDAEAGQAKIKEALLNGSIPMDELERKVKKILAYKYRLGLTEKTAIKLENLANDLNTTEAKVLRQELYNQAMTIVSAEKEMLPLQKHFNCIASVAIDNDTFSNFQNHIEQFLETTKFFFKKENDSLFNNKMDEIAQHDLVIVSINGMSRYASKNYGIADATIGFIDSLQKRTNVILCVFGNPYSLKFFENSKNILLAYEDNEFSQLAAANALLGGISCTGKLPVTASNKFRAGMSVLSDTVIRLQIATPEEAGLKTEELNKMNQIVMNGLMAHAFPGCQIAIVRDNKLIWNKASGNMTYDEQPVNTTALYDLASISKIASTTLSVMKLYDEKQLDLHKTVGDYLVLDDSATIKNLKIADILTHQAGLKAFIEFYRATIDTNTSKYYRINAEKGFSTPVANDFFIRNDYKDTMWRKMYTSPVKPEQGYVYSDIDFYILQKIVEKISGQNLDDYVAQNFYQSMNLMRTGYKPYEQFDKQRIAPTENDTLFRKQQIRGYVHDPGAAMYGGVAGHAGIFGTAVDLAQIAQLLLNKGTYNGKRFFSPETVDFFTQQYSEKSRRGLGFDKPEPNQSKTSPCAPNVPLTVFGHTGFTGTSVWADPTNHLTFIFLSNRVYPNADNNRLVRMNIRTELQRIVYEALENK